jgi:hypothetical protein
LINFNRDQKYVCPPQDSTLISDSRNEPLDASLVPVNNPFDIMSFESFDDEEELIALEDKIWVDLEDEVDDLLNMELEDESQKIESALEDINVCDDPPNAAKHTS